MRVALLALVIGAVAGCSAGQDAFAQCVEHSVEEGIAVERAEAACEDAVGRGD